MSFLGSMGQLAISALCNTKMGGLGFYKHHTLQQQDKACEADQVFWI